MSQSVRRAAMPWRLTPWLFCAAILGFLLVDVMPFAAVTLLTLTAVWGVFRFRRRRDELGLKMLSVACGLSFPVVTYFALALNSR